MQTAFARSTSRRSETAQHSSQLGPIGVQAALRAASDPFFKPMPTLLEKEFSLAGRVAIVTGAQRGIGLEMAETLAEAGAAVYCLDLPSEPDKVFGITQAYVSKLGLTMKTLWDVVESIAQKEGRIDVCVAAAGILESQKCLEYSTEGFQKLMSVNVNGVLYTAQAAGRQMVKFGTPGSIILIASMAGSVAIKIGVVVDSLILKDKSRLTLQA